MESATTSTSGRLIRALVAGGILAGGWFIADLVAMPEPAAAAATIDLVPLGEAPVSDLLDTVISISPVVAPVAEAASPILDPITTTADAVLAPLAPVTTPILEPVRDVTQPVFDTVVAPVLDGTLAVLAPVVTPVVDGLVPIVNAGVAVTPVLVATMRANDTILFGANGLSGESSPAVSIALLGALAAGAVSLAPNGPLNHGGRSPLAPESVSPSGASFLGEILGWMPALHGSPVPAMAVAAHPHASPVFESDTTPD